MRDLRQGRRARRLAVILMVQYRQRPAVQLRNFIQVLILYVRNIFGNRLVINPVFVRRSMMLVDYSDSQLYHMRILRRCHIPRLLAAFQIPAVFTCDNGTVCSGEEAFLMFIYWWSMPRLLSSAQYFFGLEYSQISRIVKSVVMYISRRWQHLVDSNLNFYAPRFETYSAAITQKYFSVYGINDPKYTRTALFTDGTQRQHNRNRRSNFSGHRKIYCYGFLVTTAPDGMIADTAGAFAGRKNDHMKQNENNLSGRLIACQPGFPIVYNTSIDKGLHTQPRIVTMFNNLINTVAQNLSNDNWAAIRVTNENCLAIVATQWKFIDYRKVTNCSVHPLGIYYELAILLSNCLNTLDHNQVSVYFDLPPPTLEQFLINPRP